MAGQVFYLLMTRRKAWAEGSVMAVVVCPGGNGCNSLIPAELLADHLENWHRQGSVSADAQTVSHGREL